MTSKVGFAPVSCLLLGEEPLLVHCAEVLRERGHHVAGVVTAAPVILRWAEDNAVRVIERPDYPAFLDREPVDVLLSITHPALIAPEDIAKARIAALNYHDGPLPRYAGMNGSTWALLNGERSHAIVWHHLTAGLDEGDIVERRDVELDPRETSVSLNLRNSMLALASFSALVDRIEERNTAGVPPRRELERLIYSRHDRPPAMCVIDWTKSADEIDRLVRACDFGPYTNRFGSAKIIRGDHGVIVREASPVEDQGTAGSILQVADDGILIACRVGALRLRRFTTLTGSPLSPLEVAKELGLLPGETVLWDWEIDPAALSRKLAEAEPFHVSALSQRTPPSLPFETVTPGSGSSCEVNLPETFMRRFGGQLTDAISALYALTVSCLIRDDTLDVAYVDGVHRRKFSSALPLLFPSVPLRVTVDGTRGFSVLVTQLADARGQLSDRPACLADLIARHPNLREQVDLQRGELSPVALLLDCTALPPGAHLGMTIHGSTCSLLSDGHVEANRLAALAGQMMSIADKVARDPGRALAQVDALDEAQRKRQVFDWNATARSFPENLRIHDLFEAQVDGQPDAVALIHDGQTTTFGELERSANRVANTLQNRGVKPGDYVGLLVDRGVELIAAMLGIVKAGCAYVPVDTSYPEDRARFMLDDARCVMVLASSGLAAVHGQAKPVVIVDGPEVRFASAHRPICSATAEDICYAIYSSGSTGQPKAVVLTHRAVVNTLDWVNRTFQVDSSDRLLFVTSPSFDLSVYDVFGALGAGASVEIGSTTLLREPADLARHLCEGQITIWNSAPPALARLCPFFPDRAPASRLRLVMLSGDWIPVWLPGVMKKVFPEVKVKSLGGATEAAIWSNFHEIEDVDPRWHSIPYGLPIQNARYYILDGHMRPLPIGIPGDLYIGGACLAQGYLNRKELTDERFVENPFLPDQRIYKTGDLARYWDDGTMEFLGRADFQVKIRGFRVEMGEVEAAIRAVPGVRDCVCTTYVDGSAQKSLVAYVVPQRETAIDGGAIKEALATKLPDFMVPSHIISIRALPLSSNGKVDRKALPSPTEAQGTAEYRPPVSPTEHVVTEIWQEILKRKLIGARDDFFDLGGHSLLAVRLVVELKNRLGAEVPLSRIFECPTVETLAASLEQSSSSAPCAGGRLAETNALIELKKGGPGCFFLVHDGDGETLLYKNLAQRLPDDFAIYGIQPRRLPRIPMADTCVSAMAASYLATVRRRQPHGPYYLGGLCAGGVIAFAMASQLEHDGEEVEIVVLLDAVEPTMRPRSGLISGRRWQRMRRVFWGRPPLPGEIRNKATNPRPEVWNALREAVRKVRNVVQYEVSRRLQAVWVGLRFRLLREILSRGWTWPNRVTSLTVRQIYMAARHGYTPDVIRVHHVVLMKASEGSDADEPARGQFDDPLLGWRRFVVGDLETIDLPGGHSSMLQEPNVEILAERLNPYLVRFPSHLPAHGGEPLAAGSSGQ